MDKELTFKTKWDLWKAAIGSILTYSLTTTKQTTMMETKLQTFVSKCLRSIKDKEEEDGTQGTIERKEEQQSNKKKKQKNENNKVEERKNNIEYRRETKTPTIMSYIEKAKICEIYRGKTTISAAYLNEKQEGELEISYWKQKWEIAKRNTGNKKQEWNTNTN